MVFSGLPFLYFFLPVLLIAYFAVPDRVKNPLLLAFSLLFYAAGEPIFILVICFPALRHGSRLFSWSGGGNSG